MIRKIIFFNLLAFSLQAQEKQAQETSLENIVVKDNRLALPFSEQSRTITIINKAQIQSAPVQSVAELLQYVAGLDIRQRGIHGAQADIQIRGGGFEQALILLNGVRMSDPQTGHHNMNLPVDIENIERIEIIKGPAARIYGQNAFAGAINIVTKVTDEKMGYAATEVGDYQLFGVNAGISLPFKGVNQYLSVAHQQSEGYRPQSDYKITNVFYQNQFGGKQKFNFLTGFTDRKMGANGWYGPEVNQRENVQTNFSSLNTTVKCSDKWTITPNAYWRRNQDRFFYGKFPSNFHLSQIVGLAVNSTYRVNAFAAYGVGIDAAYTYLTSTKLADHKRNSVNAFLEQRLTFWHNRIDFTQGVNYNYFSDFNTDGKSGKFLFGADLGVKIVDGFKAYSNIGTTYRIPSYTDLYYSDPANEGNPNLLPEQALTYEFGLKYLKNGWNIQTAYFNRSTENLIDWTRPDKNAKWKSGNIGKVAMAGFEASIDANLAVILSKSVGIKRVTLNYTNIDANINSGYTTGTLSKYALSNFKHQVVFGIETQSFWGCSLSAFYRYNEREKTALTERSYQIVDAKLNYQYQRFSWALNWNNILNQKYTEATNGVPMPPSWASASMKVKFGKHFRD